MRVLVGLRFPIVAAIAQSKHPLKVSRELIVIGAHW